MSHFNEELMYLIFTFTVTIYVCFLDKVSFVPTWYIQKVDKSFGKKKKRKKPHRKRKKKERKKKHNRNKEKKT